MNDDNRTSSERDARAPLEPTGWPPRCGPGPSHRGLAHLPAFGWSPDEHRRSDHRVVCHPPKPAAPPLRYLDLGCGVGSVLLMVSHKLGPKAAVGVEAQAQSAAMAERAVAELPEHRSHIEIRHVDFRDVDFGDERYDLITGSPPYFPLGAGVPPDDPQRRACRFEERGGVEVYLETATRAMSERSRISTSSFKPAGAIVSPTRQHVTTWNSAVKRTSSRAPTTPIRSSACSNFRDNARIRLIVSAARCATPTDSITPEYERVRQELGVATRLSLG